VLYLTVSQDDDGIGMELRNGRRWPSQCYNQHHFTLAVEFPNLVVLSAGGYGHVAIPLVKGGV
jgi:hypothetical protein